MSQFVLVDHRDAGGNVSPARHVIGAVEMSSLEASDFNRLAVRTPFRLWPAAPLRRRANRISRRVLRGRC